MCSVRAMVNEHSLHQVCHTRTSYGESRAFLWQPLRFLAHMAVRHSPERSWISNHNKSEASPPLWSGGNRADPEAFPRPSTLTERSWTARLPTARLPFCVGGKDRSGSTERGFFSPVDRGQSEKTAIVFTQAFPDMHPLHREAHVYESQNHPRVVRHRSASCFSTSR